MKLLAKFKIRTKLVTLITLMIIGILLVGLIGYQYNNKASNELAEMYNENLIPIQVLIDARAQSKTIESDLLQLMLSTDLTEEQTTMDDIIARKDLLDKDIADYGKSTLDDYEKSVYALAQANIVAWDSFSSNAVELVKEGNSAGAYALYKSTGRKTIEDFQTNVRDLASYNVKLAGQIDSQNDINKKSVVVKIILVIVITVIVAVLLGLFITISITKPISEVIKFIDKTAKLDLVYDPSISKMQNNKDETGVIIRALIEMRKALRDMAGTIIDISNNLSSHAEELTATAEENSKSLEQVVTTINELADGNNSQAQLVNKTSETISDVVNTIGSVTIATSESAENASMSLEIVANGQKAMDLVTQKMNENIVTIQETDSSINSLSLMIEKVGDFVNIITSIAEQTNLLALNAAIEAARAGEAGKGFSVVSQEIRKLAEGSSSAAKEITQVINATTEKSKQAANSMNKTKMIVDEQEKAVNITKEAFDKIKKAVEDIVSQAQESAGMLQSVDSTAKEIANQSQDMAAVAEQSAASTEEISASSEEQMSAIEMIAQASSDLSKMAEDLNAEINKFKI